MIRSLGAGWVLMAIGVVPVAHAQDALLSPHGEARVFTRLEIRHTAAGYAARDGQEGSWHRLGLEAELARSERLSYLLRQPFAYVIPDRGDGGMGLGNLGIGGRLLFWRADDRRLHGRLDMDLELPTGSEDHGIASDGAMFSPALQASYRVVEELAVLATLRLTKPMRFASGDENPTASAAPVVGQRAHHGWRHGVQVTYGGPWGHAALGVGWRTDPGRDADLFEPGETELSRLSLEVGRPVTDHLWLIGFYELPRGRREQVRWQAGVAALLRIRETP